MLSNKTATLGCAFSSTVLRTIYEPTKEECLLEFFVIESPSVQLYIGRSSSWHLLLPFSFSKYCLTLAHILRLKNLLSMCLLISNTSYKASYFSWRSSNTFNLDESSPLTSLANAFHSSLWLLSFARWPSQSYPSGTVHRSTLQLDPEVSRVYPPW